MIDVEKLSLMIDTPALRAELTPLDIVNIEAWLNQYMEENGDVADEEVAA